MFDRQQREPFNENKRTFAEQPQAEVHKGSFAATTKAAESDEMAGGSGIASSDNCEGRMKKRKVSLLFGYLGTEFRGMQINANAITVGAVLEKALFDAGAHINLLSLRTMVLFVCVSV